MLTWRVSTSRGTHEVVAADWLSALSEAIGPLDGEQGPGRFTCLALPTGGMLVRDARSGQKYVVQELEDEATEEVESLEIEVMESTEGDALKPASLVDEANEILRAPSREAAVRQTLDALLALVPADGASVILRRADGTLHFAAAVGPGSEVLANISIPEGTGLTGFCVGRRATICVRDAYKDPRFFSSIDAVTGVRTRSLLAVPIVVNGHVLGCVELINSPSPQGFGANDMTDAEYLAATLGKKLVG
ncbi:MAG: GAF domain-containing protein [Myxococcota bacterium]